MKTHHRGKLALIAAFILFFAEAGMAFEWGMVMRARSKTRIRETRSTDSRIVGHIEENQTVRADFLKDDWYAVFPLTEKDRVESKALGYVYGELLHPVTPGSPAAAPGDEKAAGKGSAALERKPDIEVKNIRFRIEHDGKEAVFIEFNRFYTPALSSIEGETPRIVLDLENVSSFKKEWAVIHAGGRLVRQIRSSMDYEKRKARIVLDMEPSRAYFVQPLFSEREHIFSLQISLDEGRR